MPPLPKPLPTCILLLALIPGLSVPSAVTAQQLAFSLEPSADAVRLDYAFATLSRDTYRVVVSVPLAEFNDESAIQVSIHDPVLLAEVETVVQRGLDATAASMLERVGAGVTIEPRASGMGYHWHWRYHDPRSLNGLTVDAFERSMNAEFTNVVHDSLRDILPVFHWTLTDTLDGRRVITTDYTGVARTYADFVQPLAQALIDAAPSQTQRDVIGFIANFVQGIPYDRLESAGSPDFATGFLTPPRLLRHNVGDCEAKSVLLAALLHAAYPDLGIVYVAIPDHGLLALDIDPLPDDRTVRVNDNAYVLLEAAGEKLSGVGAVYAESGRHLNRQAITAVAPLFPSVFPMAASATGGG